jgi:hypothetical protein
VLDGWTRLNHRCKRTVVTSPFESGFDGLGAAPDHHPGAALTPSEYGGRTKDGVSGEGDLGRRCEDANRNCTIGFRHTKKGRLGKAELLGQGEQIGVRQGFGFLQHGQLIAREGTGCEDIAQGEAGRGHWIFLAQGASGGAGSQAGRPRTVGIGTGTPRQTIWKPKTPADSNGPFPLSDGGGRRETTNTAYLRQRKAQD